jgi:beta-N-acetylhexosaminidase
MVLTYHARNTSTARTTGTTSTARNVLAALAAAAGLLLTACSGGASGTTGAADTTGAASTPGSPEPAPSATSAADRERAERQHWVEDRLSEMSLEEKVGQLFVTYVYGETADTTRPQDVASNRALLGVDNGKQAVERYHLGGVIYFGWSANIDTPAQVAGLSNGLQRAALGQSPEVPLLISTDQEHGTITRLGPPATLFPGSMALGASGRTDDAREAARISGEELRAVGINMNNAPDADVNVNPANPVIGVRSFGSDPQAVARLTAAQVEGYQSSPTTGVVATPKHFPGHGDTDVDSHTGLPVVDHSLAEWRATDEPPFRAAAESDAGAIMTGHLQFPALDPAGVPATLSEPVITGLLREDLGYDGVVITDSLKMAGVQQTFPEAEVPVRALQAGADLLLMPPDLDLAYNAVLDAVAAGELTEERIDASVRRILTLKHEQGIVGQPYADPDRVSEVVGSDEHEDAAQRITDHTTTLVKNDGAVLPLSAEGQRVLVAGAGRGATTETLAARVGARDVAVTSRHAGTDPDAGTIDKVVAAADDADTIVVATSNAAARPGQAALVEALLATGKPVVTISTDVPYDIASYPDAAAHLATYSSVPVALESATRVLFGESDPTGSLPVMVPVAGDPDQPLYPLGHGLSY